MKIIITGPESTGKSTLAAQLANHYKVGWIAEYAREYIQDIDRLYEEADLLLIAKEQLQRIANKEKENHSILFCDTSLLVVKVWSAFKYGRCDPWIEQQLEAQKVDLYFLCGLDVPWTFDAQREHPNQREELYTIYESELKKLRVPYVKMNGNAEERLKKATDLIDCLIEKPDSGKE